MVVGLVPAGGGASRLGPLPCSKEILPVGFDEGPDGPRLRPACADLLEGIAAAGAARAVVVLAEGKDDVRAYLGDRVAGVELEYLAIRSSPSVPATVAAAVPRLADDTVVFGFPDILFRPADALARLRARLEEGGADVVLGLFPADRPDKVDMVETDAEDRVLRIVPKPRRTSLRRAWILAAWTPAFTRFLAERAGDAGPGGRELYVGDVVSRAIDAGLDVVGVDVPGRFRDIGTPDDLRQALRERL